MKRIFKIGAIVVLLLMAVLIFIPTKRSFKRPTPSPESFREKYLQDIIPAGHSFNYFYDMTVGGGIAIASIETQDFDLDSYLKNNHYLDIRIKRPEEGACGGYTGEIKELYVERIEDYFTSKKLVIPDWVTQGKESADYCFENVEELIQKKKSPKTFAIFFNEARNQIVIVIFET